MSDEVNIKSGWQTSEFTATVLAILAPVVTLLAVILKIPADQVQELQTTIAVAVGALGTAGAGIIAAWRYVESRRSIKTEAIKAMAANKETRSAEKESGQTGTIEAGSGQVGGGKQDGPSFLHAAPRIAPPTGGTGGVRPR